MKLYKCICWLIINVKLFGSLLNSINGTMVALLEVQPQKKSRIAIMVEVSRFIRKELGEME